MVENITFVSNFPRSFAGDVKIPLACWLLPLAVSLLLYAYGGFTACRATEKSEERVLYACPKWIPRFVHNAIYAFGASSLLETGYTRFKQVPFQLIRNDGNIIVLPHTLLEQLSALPGSVASPHGALERDLLGQHSGLDLILESRLHHAIVQRKLTPRLPLLRPGLEKELNAAVDDYFPQCENNRVESWTSFQPYQVLAKLSARLAARALVGPSLCRNEIWLNISINYTENLFRTIVILRLFPVWSHIALRYFLPSYWKGLRYVRAAKSLLSPIIQDRIDRNNRGQWSPANNETEANVLCWLVETAKGRDRNAETLAHVEVLLALASVHTTLLRMVNVLYDLTANPEYIPELRKEIQQTAEAENGNWMHASYARLEKLDSVMRESQRMSPPTILGLKRLFKESFTFEDGTHVPKGTYVAIPIYAIENDPRITPDPSLFDGLRSYRRRQLQEQDLSHNHKTSRGSAKRDKHLFSSIEPTVLNFGYGKTACPGRYFASLAVKMVFVKLLSEYEFRFREGGGRPQNILAHEFLFCWPWQWMDVKKKQDGKCPF